MSLSHGQNGRPQDRVMVVGLDGATFDLIIPWAEAGHLPHMAQLLREGAWARLRSTIPAHSGPAWASFATGLQPGRHGIYYFIGRSQDANYFHPLSADSIRGRRFWELIGDQERTVGVINVPLTYPPKPVNGYMISGLFAPTGESAFLSKELYQEIIDHCGEYIVNAPLRQNRQAFLDELLKGMSNRLEAAEYLLDHHPTDFFIVVFRMIDSIMHRYWGDMDPNHPLRKELGHAVIPDAILSGYKLLDEAVGRLVAKAGPETTIFLMSDHGFLGEYRRFAFNKWLMDRGLLKIKSQRASLVGRVYEWAERLRLENFMKAVARRVLPLMGHKGRYEGWLYQAVDWSQTKVVFGPNVGFNINLKGRDHLGVVEPEEYESLRDWLIQEARAIRDPETGQPVIAEVHRREEIYHGETLEQSPDLVVEMALYQSGGLQWSYGASTSFSAAKLFAPPTGRLSGGHAPYGILMAYGPHIKSGQHEDANIIDLAPTIMHTMGLEVPRDMDGQVLTHIFDGETGRRPVQYADIDLTGANGDGQALFSGYENEVTARLRDLGYVE